jgi:hypothetical protein
MIIRLPKASTHFSNYATVQVANDGSCFGELPKADHPLGTHRRTPRYPHFATLIPRSKTHVSQSEARAYNQLVGEHEGCKPSNDRGFYEIGFLPRKVGLARPVCPALQLSMPVSAGPCRSHGKKACA